MFNFVDSDAILKSHVMAVFASLYWGKPVDEVKRASLKWYSNQWAIEFLKDHGLINDLDSRTIQTPYGLKVAAQLPSHNLPVASGLFFAQYPIRWV